MNLERIFAYSEPGGERGEYNEWFRITETELRRDYEDFWKEYKSSFEIFLTDWLSDHNGYEILDSYPVEEEDYDEYEGADSD